MMVMRFGLARIKGRGESGLIILDDLEAIMYNDQFMLYGISRKQEVKNTSRLRRSGYHLKDMARHNSI